MTDGWIGFDLDGTLAEWDTPNHQGGILTIGPPIPAMVEICKRYLDHGHVVKIFTARVGETSAEACVAALQGLQERHATAVGLMPYTVDHHDPRAYWRRYQERLIDAWSDEHLGQRLLVTAAKDFQMLRLYDDRCVQVIPNTGYALQDRLHALREQLVALARALSPEE